MLVRFSLVLLLFVSQVANATTCDDDVSINELKKTIESGVELVFFASWCKSCMEKMKNASKDSALLVGVLDSKDNLNEAYRHLSPQAKCVIGGAEVVKTFKVSHLPFSIKKSPSSTLN